MRIQRVGFSDLITIYILQFRKGFFHILRNIHVSDKALAGRAVPMPVIP